jgi:hypothetical protein
VFDTASATGVCVDHLTFGSCDGQMILPNLSAGLTSLR